MNTTVTVIIKRSESQLEDYFEAILVFSDRARADEFMKKHPGMWVIVTTEIDSAVV